MKDDDDGDNDDDDDDDGDNDEDDSVNTGWGRCAMTMMVRYLGLVLYCRYC